MHISGKKSDMDRLKSFGVSLFLTKVKLKWLKIRQKMHINWESSMWKSVGVVGWGFSRERSP